MTRGITRIPYTADRNLLPPTEEELIALIKRNDEMYVENPKTSIQEFLVDVYKVVKLINNPGEAAVLERSYLTLEEACILLNNRAKRENGDIFFDEKTLGVKAARHRRESINRGYTFDHTIMELNASEKKKIFGRNVDETLVLLTETLKTNVNRLVVTNVEKERAKQKKSKRSLEDYFEELRDKQTKDVRSLGFRPATVGPVSLLSKIEVEKRRIRQATLAQDDQLLKTATENLEKLLKEQEKKSAESETKRIELVKSVNHAKSALEQIKRGKRKINPE